MLCVLLVASVSGASWTAAGTNVSFSMTATTLVAKQAGTPVFDLEDEARKAHAQIEWEADQDISKWTFNETWQILSIVGSVVSYEDVNGGFTGRAFSGDYYQTVDVAKADARASLYDWVAETDVVSALKADPYIQAHVIDATAAARASTVPDLFKVIGNDKDPCIAFEASAVQTRFAFHHASGDKVALRVALPYSGGACSGHKTVLELVVPITPQLRGPLERATSRTQGFVMQNAKAAGAPKVRFVWKGATEKANSGKDLHYLLLH